MLGAAVTREMRRLNASIYQYHEPFDWKNPARISAQFGQAAAEFLAGLSGDDNWEIYWAAGIGTMNGVRADLDAETTIFGTFLSLLLDQLSGCKASGLFGFASSAGAVYAGSLDFEITEKSTVSPVNDYGKAKLLQEQMLESFVSSGVQVKSLVARFSTLFGIGQSFGKRQGLLSHITRCALRHHPVEIFVPLDTSRDYLYVDDAAADFVASLRALRGHGGMQRVRIIASERSHTISEILSTFNRLIGRRLRYVCNRSALSNAYVPRVAYRSIFPVLSCVASNKRTLLEGAAKLLHSERMAYVAGFQERGHDE